VCIVQLEPYLFGEHACARLPKVYEEGHLETGDSEDEVRHALERCFSNGSSFWATCLCPGVTHPVWWPRRGAPGKVDGDYPGREVRSYDTLIVGVGASGIGMHRDGHEDRFVSTYLTLGCGRKHVILLPPTAEGTRLAQELGGRHVGSETAESVPAFPTRPTPDVLEAVLAADGYWFDLVAEPGRGMTLFIPGGWWHWLEGASDWHVAWGGSFYSPDEVAGVWSAD